MVLEMLRACDHRGGLTMTRMRRPWLVLAVIVTAFLASIAAQPSARYDLLILNARVLDGSGNPWFPADIAVQGGRIAVVGALKNAQAARTIDAGGLYVAPGFIDIHSHADDGSSPRGGLRDAGKLTNATPGRVLVR